MAATIQGNGLAVPDQETYLLRLTDVHHVRVEGFTLQNLSTDRGDDLVGGAPRDDRGCRIETLKEIAREWRT